MEDKRKSQRFGCIGDRTFVLMLKDRLLGIIKDFSRGGISFSSTEKIAENTRLNFELELSGLNRRVPLEFEIIWKRPYLDQFIYGARFTNISSEDKFDVLDSLYRDWRKTLSADTLLR